MNSFEQPGGGFGITLNMAQSGQEYIVKNIFGGCRLRRLLLERGLTEGSKIKVIKSQSKGPIIVEFRSSRIMLDEMCARKIIIGTGKDDKFVSVAPCEAKGKCNRRRFRGSWMDFRHNRRGV